MHSTFYVEIFLFKSRLRVGFFFAKTGGIFQMSLKLIKNPDESKKLMYQVARVVYAETAASSLAAVEAMTSMIRNLSNATGQDVSYIISDKNIFDSLNQKSNRNILLSVPPTNRGFQMCLRVAGRMLMGLLPDMCRGAIRFHHDDVLPDWACARGYILDIDDLLFYL